MKTVILRGGPMHNRIVSLNTFICPGGVLQVTERNDATGKTELAGHYSLDGNTAVWHPEPYEVGAEL